MVGSGDIIINQNAHGLYPHEVYSLLEIIGINLKITQIDFLKNMGLISVGGNVLAQWGNIRGGFYLIRMSSN